MYKHTHVYIDTYTGQVNKDMGPENMAVFGYFAGPPWGCSLSSFQVSLSPSFSLSLSLSLSLPFSLSLSLSPFSSFRFTGPP